MQGLLHRHVLHGIGSVRILRKYPGVAIRTCRAVHVERVVGTRHVVVAIIGTEQRKLTLRRGGSHRPSQGVRRAVGSNLIVRYRYLRTAQVAVVLISRQGRCSQRLTVGRSHHEVLTCTREVGRYIGRGGRRRRRLATRTGCEVDLRTAVTLHDGRVIQTATTRRLRRELHIELGRRLLERYRSRSHLPGALCSLGNRARREGYRSPLRAIGRELQHHITLLVGLRIAVEVEGKVEVLLAIQIQLLHLKEVLIGRLACGEPDVTLARCGRIGRGVGAHRAGRYAITLVGRRAGYNTRTRHDVRGALVGIGPITRRGILLGRTERLVEDLIAGGNNRRIATRRTAILLALCQVDLGSRTVEGLQADIIQTEGRSERSREADRKLLGNLREDKLRLGSNPVGMLRIAVILRALELRPLLAVAADLYREVIEVERVVILRRTLRLVREAAEERKC